MFGIVIIISSINKGENNRATSLVVSTVYSKCKIDCRMVAEIHAILCCQLHFPIDRYNNKRREKPVVQCKSICSVNGAENERKRRKEGEKNKYEQDDFVRP